MNSTISTTTTMEGDISVNFQTNEDFYVRPQCTHVVCKEPSVGSFTEEKEEAVEFEGEGSFDSHKIAPVASDFSDAQCGEPMASQHLRLDFTPVGFDDDAQLQKKCSDFWEFIFKEPRLKGRMVLPEKDYEEVIARSSTDSSLKRCQNIQTPAIGWLKTEIGHKEAFAMNQTSKYCKDGAGDYVHGLSATKDASEYRLKKTSEKCAMPENLKSIASVPFARSTLSRTENRTDRRKVSSPSLRADEICSQMEQWDQKHPKCMDPPGRVPPLTHAVIQRRVPER